MPRYAKLSDNNLSLADSLINSYEVHLGKKKKELKSLVTELEDKGYEYRFVRSLSLLLDRRSSFLCNSKVDPVDLRRKIFQATEQLGLPTTFDNRQKIIANVASSVSLSTKEVEENFYSDLDGELVLEKFSSPSSIELLSAYNLGLTQTLLFEASELYFTTSGNWQNIFYAIKKFGLIYEVYEEDKIWVKIDGPASIFKLNRRYGINIAKILPVILDNSEWIIKAKVLWKFTNEVCDFKIESQTHSSLLKKQYSTHITYDSSVEEAFASQFQALNSGWVLKREPEPLPAGKQVIIPDFTLEKAGIKIYLEIVGFWTEEYLQRKIAKLRQIKTQMLLLVNQTLACEKLSSLKNNSEFDLIYYRDKIPLAPILRYLETKFEEVKSKELQTLKELPIRFTESIVDFDEFASRIGVSKEAARTFLTENLPSDYVAMADVLVSKAKLVQIDNKIKEALIPKGNLSLTEAARIIEKEGLDDSANVLVALNYKIKWRGINSEQAEISKIH